MDGWGRLRIYFRNGWWLYGCNVMAVCGGLGEMCGGLEVATFVSGLSVIGFVEELAGLQAQQILGCRCVCVCLADLNVFTDLLLKADCESVRKQDIYSA